MAGIWRSGFDIWGKASSSSYCSTTRWLCSTVVLLFCLTGSTVLCDYTPHTAPYAAIVNISYVDPRNGELHSYETDKGRYGTESRKDNEWGLLVHTRTIENKTDGCTEIVNVPKTRWIALIERGSCKFQEKIANAAIEKNASAVVVYNDKDEAELISMQHKVLDVVAIFISMQDGRQFAQLVDGGIEVHMRISLGSQQMRHPDSINKTSVLFVTVSFIVLMIISLAWLVFYYIQRFRYAHAKERLSKRLMNAAKKAIGKMPVRTMKNGDKEVENDYDQCAVCIENYRPSDVVRILPCKHMFHKSCVDPWLIESRSCPMCKLDILKAYGLQIHGSSSCESMLNIDPEAASTSIEPSEFGVASHHVAEHAPVLVVRLPPVPSSPPDAPPVTSSSASSSSSAAAAAPTAVLTGGVSVEDVMIDAVVAGVVSVEDVMIDAADGGDRRRKSSSDSTTEEQSLVSKQPASPSTQQTAQQTSQPPAAAAAAAAAAAEAGDCSSPPSPPPGACTKCQHEMGDSEEAERAALISDNGEAVSLDDSA